jgi:hypothetical protein
MVEIPKLYYAKVFVKWQGVEGCKGNKTILE